MKRPSRIYSVIAALLIVASLVVAFGVPTNALAENPLSTGEEMRFKPLPITPPATPPNGMPVKLCQTVDYGNGSVYIGCTGPELSKAIAAYLKDHPGARLSHSLTHEARMIPLGDGGTIEPKGYQLPWATTVIGVSLIFDLPYFYPVPLEGKGTEPKR